MGYISLYRALLFFFFIINYFLLQVVSKGQKSSLRAQAHCLLVSVIASIQVLSYMQGR